MCAVGSRNFLSYPAREALGFTLIELVIVLAILGMITALAVPYFGRGQESVSLRTSARDTATTFRTARGEAIRRGADIAVQVDLANRTLRVPGEKDRELGRRLHLTLYTAEQELISGNIGAIRFYPDGSATGGHLILSDRPISEDTNGKDARTIKVSVDWLTGRIDVEE